MGEFLYAIVGSSAGALIGLQFVVMTLVANMPIGEVDAQAGHIFTTPTVVHFGVVLLVSAVGIGAPWHAITTVAAVWGLVGLIGVAYVNACGSERVRLQTGLPGRVRGPFVSCPCFH